MIKPLLLALGLLGLSSPPALAHKLKIFASVLGPQIIDGYAYFVPGGRMQAGSVTLHTADGAPLARSEISSDGRFRFTVPRADTYRIHVDGGDGHAASFEIAAADFMQVQQPPPFTTPAPATSNDPPAAENPALTMAEIELSLARQIRPLREQIDAYQQEMRWHDVLGGIGYIIGLGGLAYGWSARRSPPPARRTDA